MSRSCVPYQRKSVYLLLTVPMIGLYIAIAVFLWQVSIAAFAVYCALFPFVAICQSYVCVYWQCPHVGSFAPCVGGFCLPSSQIARLFRNVRRSEGIYTVAVSLASLCLLGIVFLPVFYLFQAGVGYLAAYVGIVVAYAASFLWLICPACGTRHVCPGGQASTKVKALVRRR